MLCMHFLAAVFKRPQKEVIELKKFPIDGLEDIITEFRVSFHREISRDCRGSLKILTGFAGRTSTQISPKEGLGKWVRIKEKEWI